GHDIAVAPLLVSDESPVVVAPPLRGQWIAGDSLNNVRTQHIVEPLSSTTDTLGSRSGMQSIGCNIRRSTACAQHGRELRTKTTAISVTINRSISSQMAK